MDLAQMTALQMQQNMAAMQQAMAAQTQAQRELQTQHATLEAAHRLLREERDQMLDSLQGESATTPFPAPKGGKGDGKASLYRTYRTPTSLGRDGTFVVPKGSLSCFPGLVRVQCPWCPAIALGQEEAREHERDVHRLEACRCSDCGKGFACSEDLRRHSRATGHAIHVRFSLVKVRNPSETSSSYATSTEDLVVWPCSRCGKAGHDRDNCWVLQMHSQP
jgi:type II secretory pathway pseudopilin PulG